MIGDQPAADCPARVRSLVENELYIREGASCDAGGLACEHFGEFGLLLQGSSCEHFYTNDGHDSSFGDDGKSLLGLRGESQIGR